MICKIMIVRKDKDMQLIGLLIFAGLLILLFGLAVYIARSEKSKNKPYESWSNVLGPQFRGSAYDVGENLKKELGEGEQQFNKGRSQRHSKRKK
jgi:hypothetical protein